MRRDSKILWLSIGVTALFMVLLWVLLTGLSYSAGDVGYGLNHSFLSHTSAFLVFISYIVFVVLGFQTHWAWGVGLLILPVFMMVIFFLQYPKKSRVPAVIGGIGFTCYVLSCYC